VLSTRLHHIALTLGKELRETLRDRRTLAMMVLFPLVVYPLLSLMLGQLLVNRERKREERPSRVALSEPAGGDLRARIAASPKLFTLIEVPGDRARLLAEIQTGRLDAALAAGATRPQGQAAEILFDAARDDSREGADRLTDVLDRALPAGCARYQVKKTDLASKQRMGGYLLSKALPLALVLMVLLGAFYPAIDVTAGERERGTLETVLTAPIDRFDLLLGKVLAVAFIAALTGLLNLVSMAITLVHAVRMADAAALPVPWARAAASTLVLIPAGFLFASLFVAIGSLARGFKEAQSFLMPAYFLSIAPALIGGVGEYHLGGAAALVPAMNVTLLARELLLGQARLGPTLATLLSTLVYGGLALAFAARVYDSERFVDPAAAREGRKSAAPAPVGVDDGAPSAGMALLAFTAAFLLLWFIFVPWQKRQLVPGLLATQWLGMFGVVVLLARVTGRSLPGLIALRRPHPQALLGAALIGASAWAGVAMLSEWLVPVPKEVLDQLRKALAPAEGQRGLLGNLLLVAATPAICEEVLFRGVVLRGLATRLAPSAAVVITGVLFGMFHLDVYRLLPTVTLGVLLSWVALESGSIVTSMVAHFLNNAILVTLAMSGLEQRLSRLGKPAGVAMLGVSLALVTLGVTLVRRARREGAA
jgi:sodium transport system permease protein